MATVHPTSIRPSKETKAYLKKVCEAQGCSMMWLINKIFDEWIKWHKAEQGKKK